jgi:protein involved in polysaccharide export with SLBB domain
LAILMGNIKPKHTSDMPGMNNHRKGFTRVMDCHFFNKPYLLFLLIILSACSTAPSSGPQAMQGAMEAEPIADYRLRPGDQIEIKFFYHPELNEKFMIGPDGKISLQLIDEVLAAGLTPSQLDDVLTQEYAKYLENYSINVMVREYSGLKVYVGGEVTTPRFVSLKGNMTVLQSIFAAEGFRETAKPENVIVLRKGPDSKPMARIIDLASVMTGDQIENDIYLMPSDIVYVPKTFIAKAAKFVDQYVRQVLMLDHVVLGAGQALGWYWVKEDVYDVD